VTAQALLVSRVARLRGLAGVVLALPIVAFGAYAITAVGASIAIVRWIKTAENAADYSFMNTAKQMLWLPTTREQKYKGKQAIDTFFVRFGDMLAAGVIFVGTNIDAVVLGIRPDQRGARGGRARRGLALLLTVVSA
jgi:AAA family ATP:ADP antiporter